MASMKIFLLFYFLIHNTSMINAQDLDCFNAKTYEDRKDNLFCLGAGDMTVSTVGGKGCFLDNTCKAYAQIKLLSFKKFELTVASLDLSFFALTSEYLKFSNSSLS